MYQLAELRNSQDRHDVEPYRHLLLLLLQNTECQYQEPIPIHATIVSETTLHEHQIKVTPSPKGLNGVELKVKPSDARSTRRIMLSVPTRVPINAFIQELSRAIDRIENPPKEKPMKTLSLRPHQVPAPKQVSVESVASAPIDASQETAEHAPPAPKSPKQILLEKILATGESELDREAVVDLIRESYGCESKDAIGKLVEVRRFYHAVCPEGTYRANRYEFDLDKIEYELSRFS